MCKSLGPVSFVIDDKISRLLTTRLYGWMDGWAAWSTHFRNRVQLGQSRCMGGLALDLRLSTSFYTFNEDGATLLMRRTGWARTNISHENGWNDIAWLYDWLVRYTYITFTRKVLCIPIFSNFNGGANVCTVLLQQLAKRPKYFEACTWKVIPQPP